MSRLTFLCLVVAVGHVHLSCFHLFLPKKKYVSKPDVRHAWESKPENYGDTKTVCIPARN